MSASTAQEIREVLQKFQDGYIQRDPSLMEDFRTLFAPEDELEVIGTGGITPGDDEWCLDQEAARNLVINDWESWGDLTLDIADARISVRGDVAWLATTGTVRMDIPAEETYRDYMDYIHEVAADEEMQPRDKLIEILRGGTNTLFEAERGGTYTWPLRFTAVLERREAGWLFRQMQFSFATTRFPDVRNL